MQRYRQGESMTTLAQAYRLSESSQVFNRMIGKPNYADRYAGLRSRIGVGDVQHNTSAPLTSLTEFVGQDCFTQAAGGEPDLHALAATNWNQSNMGNCSDLC